MAGNTTKPSSSWHKSSLTHARSCAAHRCKHLSLVPPHTIMTLLSSFAPRRLPQPRAPSPRRPPTMYLHSTYLPCLGGHLWIQHGRTSSASLCPAGVYPILILRLTRPMGATKRRSRKKEHYYSTRTLLVPSKHNLEPSSRGKGARVMLCLPACHPSPSPLLGPKGTPPSLSHFGPPDCNLVWLRCTAWHTVVQRRSAQGQARPGQEIGTVV
jgi:hypothetical protein